MRLIDADMFKTRLEHEAWSRGHVELLRARDIADETPTVDPVKHGRWIWVQYDANPKIGNFHCSVCGFIPATYNSVTKQMNHCPHCGAMMDLEEDDEKDW